MVVPIPSPGHIKHPPEAMVDVGDLHILKWRCTILGVWDYLVCWGLAITIHNKEGYLPTRGIFMAHLLVMFMIVYVFVIHPGPVACYLVSSTNRHFWGIPWKIMWRFSGMGHGPCWAMFFPRHRLMPALLLVRWHPLQSLRFWKCGLHWSLLCQSGRGSQCEYSLRQAQGIRPQMSQKHRICHALCLCHAFAILCHAFAMPFMAPNNHSDLDLHGQAGQGWSPTASEKRNWCSPWAPQSSTTRNQFNDIHQGSRLEVEVHILHTFTCFAYVLCLIF